MRMETCEWRSSGAVALYPERAAETVPLLEAALGVEAHAELQEEIRGAITQLGNAARSAR